MMGVKEKSCTVELYIIIWHAVSSEVNRSMGTFPWQVRDGMYEYGGTCPFLDPASLRESNRGGLNYHFTRERVPHASLPLL